MEIKIAEERENPLLERRELKVKVIHDAASPSREAVKEKLVVLLNAGKDTVILGSLKSRFGTRESTAAVKVYKTKERALQVETRHSLERNSLIERAKKVEKPKEEAKPEVKKEEKPKAEKKEGGPKPEAKKVEKPKEEAKPGVKKEEKPKAEKKEEKAKPEAKKGAK